MKKIYYYNSWEDDIIVSQNQNYQLKKNFKWVHTNIFYKFLAFIIYILVLFISFIYSKLWLRVKIVNRKILKKEKAYFLYSNHTLEFGDIFNPFLICFPNHPFFICSAANMGIPILGKLLPIAGAIPIPDNIHDMQKFQKAINYYINKGKPIIIYPEAHLWPYATFIRNLTEGAFTYPAASFKKVFVATTTYSKSKIFKRPKITIYIDGPFTSDENLTKRENRRILHDKVSKTMQKRSQLSDYKYVTYQKKQ